MRTCEDVVKRLKWDPVVDVSHVTVGYLDRFVGTVEAPFVQFDWETDLALVDDTAEKISVPQHRLQYFKYKNDFMLWEKSTRTDNVFGSTGGIKLEEFIKECDEAYLEADISVILRFYWEDIRRRQKCIEMVVAAPECVKLLEVFLLRVSQNITIPAVTRTCQCPIPPEDEEIGEKCEVFQVILPVRCKQGSRSAEHVSSEIVSAIRTVDNTGLTSAKSKLWKYLTDNGVQLEAVDCVKTPNVRP